MWILSPVLRYWELKATNYVCRQTYETVKSTNVCVKNVYHRCLCCISHQVTMAEKQNFICRTASKNYLYLGGKHELHSKYLTIVPQWAAAKKEKNICKPYTFICLNMLFITWVMFLNVVKARLRNVKSHTCLKNPPIIDLALWILLREHGKYFIL